MEKENKKTIEIPFGKKDSELYKFEYTIPEGYEAEIKDGKVIVKKKESEDERIRKELLEEIEFIIPHDDETDSEGLILPSYHARIDRYKSYLEKQKEPKLESCDCSRDEESYTNGIHHVLMNPEAYGLIKQKPAEWRDTDMNEARNNLISVCRDWERGEKTTLLPVVAVRARYFLEHLTEPKPAEWSEEFLRLMGITISQDGNQVCVLLGENLAEGIAGFGDTLADAVEEFKKEWRQFDRFRKATWKPSEEQMKALEQAMDRNDKLGYLLRELHDKLKNL